MDTVYWGQHISVKKAIALTREIKRRSLNAQEYEIYTQEIGLLIAVKKIGLIRGEQVASREMQLILVREGQIRKTIRRGVIRGSVSKRFLEIISLNSRLKIRIENEVGYIDQCRRDRKVKMQISSLEKYLRVKGVKGGEYKIKNQEVLMRLKLRQQEIWAR